MVAALQEDVMRALLFILLAQQVLITVAFALLLWAHRRIDRLEKRRR